MQLMGKKHSTPQPLVGSKSGTLRFVVLYPSFILNPFSTQPFYFSARNSRSPEEECGVTSGSAEDRNSNTWRAEADACNEKTQLRALSSGTRLTPRVPSGRPD